MKVAFYAPMKSPRSPTPSGDRLIGRLLIRALVNQNIDVELMSQFRAYNRDGNNIHQQRLQSVGQKLAGRLLRQIMKRPPADRPDIWFTYHLYHKAPDWIGPKIARALNIPYVVAEASFALKQTNGPWRLGHDAVRRILAETDLVIGFNSQDRPGVTPCLAQPERYQYIPPFLDAARFQAAALDSKRYRQEAINQLDLDASAPLLLTVAMMREGDKVESYQVLAKSLALISELPWQLLVVGTGPAREKVQSMFSSLSERIYWMGEVQGERLAEYYAAADLFIWPAVKESPGMCFLEAQAAGTAVVGSNGGGVPDVVLHGKTGLLSRHLDEKDFARQVRLLLLDKKRMALMGESATLHIARNHRIEVAGLRLERLLRGLLH